MHFLRVLEASSLNRGVAGLIFLRLWGSGLFQASVFALEMAVFILTCRSSCACVHISPSYKDTSHTGVGPSLLTSFLLDHLLKTLSEALEVRILTYEFGCGGHNSAHSGIWLFGLCRLAGRPLEDMGSLYSHFCWLAGNQPGASVLHLASYNPAGQLRLKNVVASGLLVQQRGKVSRLKTFPSLCLHPVCYGPISQSKSQGQVQNECGRKSPKG